MATRSLHVMERSGGLFLCVMGAAIIAATLSARIAGSVRPVDLPVLLVGAASAIVVLVASIVVARRRGERPRGIERGAALGSIALEAALFTALPQVIGPAPAETIVAVGLGIVGLHFLPFAIALGAKSALLGIVCMAAAAGALAGLYTLSTLLLIDGALKIAVGAWMYLAPAMAGGAGGAALPRQASLSASS